MRWPHRSHLISAGVHSIVSRGSTGEYQAQTIEERIEIARFTLERIAGRVPLIVGTGASAGPPLKPLNKDDKRELEQVVRVLRRTIAAIQAEDNVELRAAE